MQTTRHLLPLPNARPIGILVPSDESDDIARSIAHNTYSIPSHYRLLQSLLPSPGRVIDLGAHIGTFALYAAAMGHEVVAVDASEQNVAMLKESCSLNGFDRLRVIRAAITDSPGFVQFTELGPYGLVATPRINWETVRVPAITGDGLLDEVGWRDASFIKMDIEGSEVAALRGMRRLIAQTDVPILFESNGHTLHFYDQSPKTLLGQLEQAGYTCWEVSDYRLRSVASTDLQFVCVVDYLAVKDELPAIKGWVVEPRRSPDVQIEMAIASCCHANENHRAHAGRTLQFADASIRSDARVLAALRNLAIDARENVRESVHWAAAFL